MRRFLGFFARLGGLFSQRRREKEIKEELASHLQMHIEENLRSGMGLEAARRDALIKLGGVESTRESCLDQGGVPVLEKLWQDLRYGVRMLLKNPGFSAAAILTLALGIGANTAIFSIVNALIFRPLPFREPTRLVWIANPVQSGEGLPGLSRQSNLRSWRELSGSFEALGGYLGYSERMNYTLTGRGEPVRLHAVAVTGNFLKVMGVRLQLGREFSEEECQRNGPNALIITERFWKQRFHGDEGIVGQSISINGQAWTVAGVLPASFDFTSVFTPGSSAADFLRPYPEVPGDHWGNFWAVVGRLKPGLTVRQAQAEMDLVNHQLRSAYPARGSFEAVLSPLREHISGRFRRPFLVLSCAVGCVLLIACANLSNLLLARAGVRRKEIAVRSALGAGRWRLVSQMLTESLLLSGCGGVLGLLLAYLATDALAHSGAFSIPLLPTAGVDCFALGFTLLIACATGILFGLAPALQLSRARAHADLKEASRGTSHGPGRTWMRELLVASEAGLACVLLVGAGLLGRSFLGLLDVDLGFRPEQVAVWHIKPSRDFTDVAQEFGFHKEVVRRIGLVPGVESAGMTATLPLGLNDVVTVRAKGETYRQGEVPSAYLREVDQGYFKTMRIPLREGRPFDSYDQFSEVRSTNDTEELVIVNEKLVRTLWPGRDAIGRTLLIEDRSPPLQGKVIGVVGDVRLTPSEPGGPEIYLLSFGRDLVVRAKGTIDGLVPSVRSVLLELDPNMPPNEFKLLSRMVDQTVSPNRFVTVLLVMFSLVAVCLASIGIYGVIAYSVSQRTHEIGIRLALGASSSGILWLVTREGMRPALLGGAGGLAASLGLARVVQPLLFGVSPTDPLTFLTSGLVLAGVALIACWLPARRAARLDPMTALRHD